MKRFLLFLLLLSFSMTASAVDLLDGYYVTPNNDTVHCKIKGGRFLTAPFYGITIIDPEGKEQSLPAKDRKIIAFGFVERFRKYDYLFVEVGDKLENGFYQRIVDGPRYKLYSRPTQIYGGNPTYVLFNPAGAFTKFEPCLVCPWKKQLRELLKDDAKALEMVDKAPRVDIPKFVIDINQG